jgi:hypothetical protein
VRVIPEFVDVAPHVPLVRGLRAKLAQASGEFEGTVAIRPVCRGIGIS